MPSSRLLRQKIRDSLRGMLRESKSIKEDIGDSVIVGLYGDDSYDLGDYSSLDAFVSACRKRGISTYDVEDHGYDGWELHLSGDPRTIYSLVNNRVRGYNMDSLSDFIDEYSLDESRSLREEDKSFTIEYREDGKTKYSSVSGTSESDALNKFRNICKDMKRNVQSPKVVTQDSESPDDIGTLTEAYDDVPDYRLDPPESDLTDEQEEAEYQLGELESKIQSYHNDLHIPVSDISPYTEGDESEHYIVDLYVDNLAMIARLDSGTNSYRFCVIDNSSYIDTEGNTKDTPIYYTDKSVPFESDPDEFRYVMKQLATDFKSEYIGYRLDILEDQQSELEDILNPRNPWESKSITEESDEDGVSIFGDDGVDWDDPSQGFYDDPDEDEDDDSDEEDEGLEELEHYIGHLLDGKEFWTRPDELVQDLEETGLTVDEANDEYILVSDEDWGWILDVEIAGSSRTISYRDGSAERLPESSLVSGPRIVERLMTEDGIDDDPEDTDQTYTSADTSINSSKLPAIYKLVDFHEGDVVLDYGGGRFDNGIEYLESLGCIARVYDPYNRSSDYNSETLSIIRQNGGADIVLCSNVLNVIDTESARLTVLKNMKKYVKSSGTVYITVYEGSGSGAGGATKAGYQLNRKTADYLEEIGQVFSSVTRKGKLIIAK